jgi:hypothetical protein
MGHMIAIVLAGAIGLVLLSASAIWLFQIVAIPLRALYEVIVARTVRSARHAGGWLSRLRAVWNPFTHRLQPTSANTTTVGQQVHLARGTNPGTDYLGVDPHRP